MASTEEWVELLIDGARYGDADDVHKALEHKVDVNAQDEWGKSGGRRCTSRSTCMQGHAPAASQGCRRRRRQVPPPLATERGLR
jgi:hypothetical protein